MKPIDEEIRKNDYISRRLKYLYLSTDKISYEKSREIQRQQNIAYNKMLFFKELKKEMNK